MATFNVTTALDNGLGDTEGTLSYAIKQANTIAGDDTISLNTNVRLTGATATTSFINSNITIVGNGNSISGDANNNVINDSGDVRALFIQSGTVNLNNLTITNGRAQGGNGGGGAAGMGGGLFIFDGNVSLNNVILSQNSAIGGGGNGGNGLSFGGGNAGLGGSNGNNGNNGSGYNNGSSGSSGSSGGFGGGGGYGGNGGDADEIGRAHV